MAAVMVLVKLDVAAAYVDAIRKPRPVMGSAGLEWTSFDLGRPADAAAALVEPAWTYWSTWRRRRTEPSAYPTATSDSEAVMAKVETGWERLAEPCCIRPDTSRRGAPVRLSSCRTFQILRTGWGLLSSS
jgi:hypothetical protein